MSSSRHITENDRSIAARAAAASISAQGKRILESAPAPSNRGQPMVQSISKKTSKGAGEKLAYLPRSRMGSSANIAHTEPDANANTKQRYNASSAPHSKLSRRNTWNNINSSSSSIALAAASSIAKSNTSVLSSQPQPSAKTKYTVHDSQPQQSKMHHSNQEEVEATNKSIPHDNTVNHTSLPPNVPHSAVCKRRGDKPKPSIAKLTTDMSSIKVGHKDFNTSNTKSSSSANGAARSNTNSPVKSPEVQNSEDLPESSFCTSASMSEDSFASWDVDDNNNKLDSAKFNSCFPMASDTYLERRNVYGLPSDSSYSSNQTPTTPQSNKMFLHHRSKSKSSRIKSIFGFHQHPSKQHFPSSTAKIETHPYINSHHGPSLSNNLLPTDSGPTHINDSLSSLLHEGNDTSLKNTIECTTNESTNDTNELPGKNLSSLSLPIQNIPHLNSQQQLNFPSTLRKEKKSGKMGLSRSRGKQNGSGGDEFNEDKPWKHRHSIAMLNIIDMSEKKRYDGVFVTNKGCYILDDVRLAKVMEELKKAHSSTLENQAAEVDHTIVTEDDMASVAEKQGDEDTSGSYLDTLAGFVNTYSIPTDRIHGLVVREIWKRSKLDSETLFRLWNLVLSNRKLKWSLSIEKELTDENGNTVKFDTPVESFDDGTLTREEFIVGMWVIDQCLYGRKLPRAIPKNVWDSVNSDLLSNAANLKKWKKHNRLIEGHKVEDSTGKRKLFKKVVGK